MPAMRRDKFMSRKIFCLVLCTLLFALSVPVAAQQTEEISPDRLSRCQSSRPADQRGAAGIGNQIERETR
jgi:hypothetical protein